MNTSFFSKVWSPDFIRRRAPLIFLVLLVWTTHQVEAQSLLSMDNGVVTYGYIYATQYDTVNGNLYIGGNFKSVNGVPASNVAVWNGSTWNSLGSGITGTVLSMKLVGNDLFVGGFIQV